MKNLFILASFLPLLISCIRGGEALAKLDDVFSYIESRPDSALTVCTSLFDGPGQELDRSCQQQHNSTRCQLLQQPRQQGREAHDILLQRTHLHERQLVLLNRSETKVNLGIVNKWN